MNLKAQMEINGNFRLSGDFLAFFRVLLVKITNHRFLHLLMCANISVLGGFQRMNS